MARVRGGKAEEPEDMLVIDAYCHVGQPRFGAVEDVLRVWDRFGVRRGVLVLGPAVPDYAGLFGALREHGDRVRGIGIPFGGGAAQVRESVELQLRAGVIGLRAEPAELDAWPQVLEILGEAGAWLFAIAAAGSDRQARRLGDWLERYPRARVAAPHFVQPGQLLGGDVDDGLVRRLLGNDRFVAILSRHGGNGTRRPYPYDDQAQWVRQTMELVGWKRIAWGSEWPVLCWRNETMTSATGWLRALLREVDEARMAAFLGGNAQTWFFDAAPPEAREVTIPPWVDQQFNRARTIGLFPGGLPLPMAEHPALLRRYVEAVEQEAGLTFGEFIIRLIGRSADAEPERPAGRR